MTSSQLRASAPDGGYGWVIVFCSFMIHILGPAMLLSLSVMYVSWLEEFGSSRSITSWTVSLAVAMFLTVGPVVASLANRFGNRATVIVGGILIFLGFSLSYFATSITMMIVYIGCVAGCGVGFCYLPAISSVAIYFEKRRSLAMGIATSGTGIGSFVLAPVNHWLIQTFGWRGTLLIAGACQLNLCALGLLMRPLKPKTYEMEVNQGNESTTDLFASESLLKTDNGNASVQEYPKKFSAQRENIGKALYSDLNGEDFTYQVAVSNGGAGYASNGGGSLIHLAPPYASSPRAFSSATELHGKPRPRASDTSRLALDVMMTGSLHSLSMIDPSGTTLRPAGGSSYSLCGHDTDSVRAKEKRRGKVKACFAVFLSIFTNFSLLKRPDFLVFIISNVLTNLSYLMPVLYMVDRAMDRGIDKGSSAALVSVYGAGNVLGRLICGFLGDRNLLDRMCLYVVNLSVCGLATCLSPLCGGMVALHALYAFMFGTTIGAFTTMVPMVTVDIVGVSQVGQAYGVVLLFSGIPGAFGPPLAGLVYDWTGDFTASFVLHGVFVLLSAIVLLPVLIMKRVRK